MDYNRLNEGFSNVRSDDQMEEGGAQSPLVTDLSSTQLQRKKSKTKFGDITESKK